MFLQEKDDGLLLQIKVQPNASKNEITGIENDRLKIKISSPPEKGKANLELIHFLAKIFKVPKSSITIVRGETSSLKSLFIFGASKEEALKIVTCLLEARAKKSDKK